MLKDDGLHLQPVYEVTKVQNPTPEQRKFRQDIRYYGAPLVIRTAPIPSNLISICENSYGKYVSLPVDAWLRKQLSTLDDFITTNLNIPPVLADGWKAVKETDAPYKVIWQGDRLFISLSHWCSCLKQEQEYLNEMNFSDIGDGTLNIAISILGVYYGIHKENKLASVSMFVQSMLYTPAVKDFDVILDSILDANATDSKKPVKNVRRKRKKDNQ